METKEFFKSLENMARMGQNLLKELRRGNQFYDQNMFIISGHTSFNSQNPRHMFQTSSLNDSGIQDKLQPEQKLLTTTVPVKREIELPNIPTSGKKHHIRVESISNTITPNNNKTFFEKLIDIFK